MKLITKLIRLEEKTIEDINELKNKLDGEYISFASLVRKLIKVGLLNFENKDDK
jgi:hypothetical protein